MALRPRGKCVLRSRMSRRRTSIRPLRRVRRPIPTSRKPSRFCRTRAPRGRPPSRIVAKLRGKLAAPATYSNIHCVTPARHKRVRRLSSRRHPCVKDLSSLARWRRCGLRGVLAIAIIFLAGCEKKSFSKTELRAVTDEIVSAAQRVAGRKSEITIRPEVQAIPQPARDRRAPADNIYISLADSSQGGALRQRPRGNRAAPQTLHRGILHGRRDSLRFFARWRPHARDSRGHAARRPRPPAISAPAPTESRSSPSSSTTWDTTAPRPMSLLALPFPLTISDSASSAAFRRGRRRGLSPRRPGPAASPHGAGGRKAAARRA